ncbi:MAG: hypothetical protein Q7S52_03850 [bacterium]|nr:hypothetical protein [bacterium]
MTPDAILAGQTALRNWIDGVHERHGSEPLSKEEFLQESWRVIAGLVHYNKQNLLIRHAVREHPDLVPRAFTILSVLYGTYTAPPSKIAVLMDFVAMLGKDLAAEESSVCAYAKESGAGSFFPELFKILETIRKIYGAEYFSREALPPTLYQAYVIYVLNHTESLKKDVSTQELFGYLSADDSKMRVVVALAKPPDTSPPPESSAGHTLH